MSTALAVRGSTGVSVPQSKSKLIKSYISSRKALARVKAKGEETLMSLVDTAEVTTAAFVLGGYQGMRAGKGEAPAKLFGKVNLELAIAALLHGGALFLSDKSAQHARSFGNGALAAFATNWGRGIGYKWAREREAGGQGQTSGNIHDTVADFLRSGS